MPKPSDILGGKPSEGISEYRQRLADLHARYTLNDTDSCMRYTKVFVERLCEEKPPWQVLAEMEPLVGTLFLENDIFILGIPPNLSRDHTKIIESALTEGPAHVDRATRAFIDFYSHFVSILPQMVFQTDYNAEGQAVRNRSATTIHLADTLDARQLLNVIMHTLSPVSGPEGYAIFHVLNEDIKTGFYKVAGYTRETYRGQKLKGVAEITEAQAREILAATPFKTVLETRIEFTIPDKFWKEHCFIAAPTGHGKTQTLQHFIAQFLPRQDVSMFIVDSKGSIVKLLKDRVPPERLVLLDPTSNSPPRLNFFQLQADDDLYFYLFKAIDQTLTTRQETMVAYLVALMRKIPGANLDTLRNLCERKDNPYAGEIAHLQQIEQDFFNNQMFSGKDAFVNQTKQQIVQRLYTVGRMRGFNEMFNASTNEFDAAKCMDENKIVLVNTDVNNLKAASAVFGRFVIAACLTAARMRKQRNLALLLVDEAAPYMDAMTETILSTAREFGLSLTQATQFWRQVPDQIKASVLGNIAIKIVGPLSATEATALSRDMHCTPEFITRMKSYDRDRVEWACHVRNYTDNAIKLTVPMGVLEKIPNAQSLPKAPPEGDSSIPLPDDTGVIITPPPPKPSPAAARPSPRFIPGVGQHVQVYVGKDGIAFYPHGATITQLDITAGRAWVDPRPHAKQDDPGHCFEEPKTSVAFSELGPFEPATDPPHLEHPRKPENRKTRDPNTDYDAEH